MLGVLLLINVVDFRFLLNTCPTEIHKAKQQEDKQLEKQRRFWYRIYALLSLEFMMI